MRKLCEWGEIGLNSLNLPSYWSSSCSSLSTSLFPLPTARMLFRSLATASWLSFIWDWSFFIRSRNAIAWFWSCSESSFALSAFSWRVSSPKPGYACQKKEKGVYFLVVFSYNFDLWQAFSKEYSLTFLYASIAALVALIAACLAVASASTIAIYALLACRAVDAFVVANSLHQQTN